MSDNVPANPSPQGPLPVPPTEPPWSLTDPAELLPAYLDYYRATVLAKLDGLSEAELRGSRLPSGWSPLELLKHLAYVERRWLRWGFLGEEMDERTAWGDDDPESGRWRVREDESPARVRGLFAEECEYSRRIVAAAGLRDRAASTGRFPPPAEPPTLSWILFHVLQEYARHTGHLDVVRELTDGRVGE
ncbi:DinB family protein [Streptomyces sp. NPDC088923]|uniref:DinB family protein n=1 Tax=Streptomyces sp. NPDC088923 TaxID=3365913 RepID=UPI00382B4928